MQANGNAVQVNLAFGLSQQRYEPTSVHENCGGPTLAHLFEASLPWNETMQPTRPSAHHEHLRPPLPLGTQMRQVSLRTPGKGDVLAARRDPDVDTALLDSVKARGMTHSGSG